MRRFIAYSALAASMLVAVGVSTTPVMTQINGGREFSQGHEIVFNVDQIEGQDFDENAADKVASEMRTRLDNFDIEDYSIKVQKPGADDSNIKTQKVTVSFACDEEDMFNNICRYLCFSGTDFSMTSNSKDKSEELSKKDIIDYKNVRIEQVNERIPLVVIPLTESGKGDLENLISSISGDASTSETASMIKKASPIHSLGHDEHGNPTPEEQGDAQANEPDLYLWANAVDGDSYEESLQNPLVASKIIMGFRSENVWYTQADGAPDDYEEHTAIKIICGTMSGESYDFGKLKDANTMAKYYQNMLQASKYDYEISCPTANVTTSGGIDYFDNATEVDAYAEPLFVYNGMNENLAPSTFLLTTLISLVAVCVFLAVYYKLLSIGMIATTVSTVFITYLAFIKLGALFNIPSLIGGIIIAGASLITEIYYISRFKEEVYKGRSFKKANQEASKKANLFTLDVAVVVAFAGLMTYLLGGVSLKPLGVVLFFGSIISMLINLIVYKLLMYLVTNSTDLQASYRGFGIKKEFVPNLMVEQKATYVAPFEKVDFTKKKGIVGLVFAALSVASLAGIIVFGVKDNSPLNIANATKETAIAYVSINSDETVVNSETTFKDYALKDISYDSLEMKEIETYDSESKETNKSLYFIVNFDKTMSPNDIIATQQTINDNLLNEASLSSEKFSVEALNSLELNYTPNQGLVALATGISILGAAVYFMFRFKPSRGLSILISTTASSVVAYGVITLCRIGTSAITSLAMPIVALNSLLVSIIYLTYEKALLKENREDMTDEKRREITAKALGKAALPSFIFMIIAAFVTVCYFGLGLPLTTFMFVSILIGELVSFGSLFIVCGPLANVFASWFAKIRLPKIKLAKKEAIPFQQKQKSSEPEETTFIGIND